MVFGETAIEVYLEYQIGQESGLYNMPQKYMVCVVKNCQESSVSMFLFSGDYICFSFNFIQPTFEVFKVGISFQSFNNHGRENIFWADFFQISLNADLQHQKAQIR